MNAQEIPDADYIVQDAAMNFEPCAEGELYMICQGAGGGYGDVLERDPELVIKDLEENLLSPDLAREIYFVVFNEETLVLDRQATEAARNAERKARLKRATPFDQFCERWVKPEPAPKLPYLGSWGDETGDIIATHPEGGRYRMTGAELTGIMLSNPKDRRIAELELELAEMQAKKK